LGISAKGGGDLLQLGHRRPGDLPPPGRLIGIALVRFQRGQLRVQVERGDGDGAKSGIGLGNQASTALLVQRVKLLMLGTGMRDQGIQEAVSGSDRADAATHRIACSNWLNIDCTAAMTRAFAL
jgi:hypothetical protein